MPYFWMSILTVLVLVLIFLLFSLAEHTMRTKGACDRLDREVLDLQRRLNSKGPW